MPVLRNRLKTAWKQDEIVLGYICSEISSNLRIGKAFARCRHDESRIRESVILSSSDGQTRRQNCVGILAVQFAAQHACVSGQPEELQNACCKVSPRCNVLLQTSGVVHQSRPLFILGTECQISDCVHIRAVRNSHPSPHLSAPMMLLSCALSSYRCSMETYTSASERRLDDLLADQEVSKLFAFLPLLNTCFRAFHSICRKPYTFRDKSRCGMIRPCSS